MGGTPCIMAKYFTYKNYSLLLKNDKFYWVFSNGRSIRVTVTIQPLQFEHVNESHIDLYYPKEAFIYATSSMRYSVRYFYFWEKIFHIHYL